MAGGSANNTLADDQKKEPKKTKLQSFLEFVYNKKEGKVLGRTGKSWLEITVFYIIFYSCLAGFFAANLAIFLQTLDTKWPRYYGKGSIIGINPGLGYQPWLKSNAESTLIKFNKDDRKTYEKYTEALQDFFDKYNVTEKTEGLRKCTGKQSNRDESNEACMFDLDEFKREGCGPPHFGFDEGKPCVVLTLNKLIAWEPVSYPTGSLPETLPPSVRRKYAGDIAIGCEGEAMVKFEGLKRGVLVEVECKAFAYNIIHDRANRLGMVHFELFKLNEPVKHRDDADESMRESSTDDS